MIVQYRKKFEKDLSKIRNIRLLQKVEKLILEVETLAIVTPKGQIPKINKLKKLSNFPDKYRIRLGDWRIGLTIELKLNKDNDIFWFERILNRKSIYRFFP